MSIEITTVRIDELDVDRKEDGEVRIRGKYSLISNKGIVVAQQEFNKYDSLKFSLDPVLGKNFISDIETAIELELGIQEAVKQIKG